MNKKVLLMILDGWGEGPKDRSNAIYTAGTPNIDALRARYPLSFLSACGQDVGLPEGQMGNSEVGHLNIGGGRIVYQDLVKINRACRDGSLRERPELVKAYRYVKESGKKLHLMGLLSNGGVHSSIEHLLSFCDIAKMYGLDKVFIHAIMDGRDTDPHSGKGFIEQLQRHVASETSTGRIASVAGRFYTMDRDKRWERIKKAYDLYVKGLGTPTLCPAEAVENSYAAGVTDEFIQPIVCTDASGKPLATIEEGDAVLFFNFRNDRAREITRVLTQTDMPEYDMHTLPLYYCCLTPYDDSFTGLHILFDKEHVKETLGETVSRAGLRQLRIAETEKYAHVTFFFSGGREEKFEGEDRCLIPSPQVKTYDLQPQMCAPEVKDAVVKALLTEKYDLIVLNFANGDMVGHTGVYDAICQAVRTVDACVREVVAAATSKNYTVLLTADHGNADHAINADGTPNTAHSLNKVPFIVIDEDVKSVENGILADIAPTILHLMGLPAPEAMTGHSLISR